MKLKIESDSLTDDHMYTILKIIAIIFPQKTVTPKPSIRSYGITDRLNPLQPHLHQSEINTKHVVLCRIPS